MNGRPWSLARRLSGLFLASITFFVVAIAGLTVWLVRASVNADLDGLPHEELVELRGHLELFTGPNEDLENTLADLERDHVPCAFAWRIWLKDGPPIEYGKIELLGPLHPRKPSAGEPESTQAFSEGTLRWKTETLAPNVTVGVVIDGAPRLELLHRYEGFALVVIAVAILIAFGISTLVFRRVSHMLREVAARVRSVKRPDEPVDMRVSDAPIEIQEVSDALGEMLANIRRELDQARLFTAGLAHELRSPVQNLIGETEVALIQQRDGATYREVLRSNLDELRSLGDAVDNLVTICSAGDRSRTLPREHFDLAAEASLRLRREIQTAERQGIALTLHHEGDCHVTGDREALLRAVRNLTANAIQWTERGGRVDVRIAGGAEFVDVTVDDDGPGVPVEIHDRIFEPFFRGPSARGRRIGYGLGLALARTAALEQGGRVAIGSAPSGGARFELRLPRRATKAEDSARPA